MNNLITNELPTRSYNCDIRGEIVKKIYHLVLPDPTFNRVDKIMMVLGADIYSRIIKSSLFNSNNGSVIAQNTALSWNLTGACDLNLIV